MTTKQFDPVSVLETAMQIIRDEHRHLMIGHVECDEHRKRIIRIALSAGTLLQSTSKTKKEIEVDMRRIVDYGQLLIDEWTEVVPGKDENSGIQFHYCVPTRCKSKKGKPSNKAL